MSIDDRNGIDIHDFGNQHGISDRFSHIQKNTYFIQGIPILILTIYE